MDKSIQPILKLFLVLNKGQLAGLPLVAAVFLAWVTPDFLSGPLVDRVLTFYAMANDDGASNSSAWAGPILWYNKEIEPLEMILVEKATQELRLLRFDGSYKNLNTFKCASGENPGKKQKEKDGKTPEGIYFNNKIYRDTQVTVFGNRAFGINYPDVFDQFEQNGGTGIFLHGSNKEITPYSTNGCVVLDNEDLIRLDPHIQTGKTPIIIGERLPYLFGEVSIKWNDIIPFLEKALVPVEIANDIENAQLMCLVGYGDRVVAMGRLFPKNKKKDVMVRLYLSGTSERLLILVKREWEEAKAEEVLPKKNYKIGVVATDRGGTRTKENRAAPSPGNTGLDESTGHYKQRLKPADGESTDGPQSAEVYQIKQMVESWRQSWQAKDLNTYISHYHGQFVGNGKGLKEWKVYKQSLNNKYQNVSVHLSDLKVTVMGHRAMITFTQKYRSEQFQSIDLKNMELRKQGDSWKIFSENARTIKPANQSI